MAHAAFSYEGNIPSEIEALEFLIKDDKTYTTDDLKRSEMLIPVRRMINSGFVTFETVYIPVDKQGVSIGPYNNSKYHQMVKLYSISDKGKNHYNDNKEVS